MAAADGAARRSSTGVAKLNVFRRAPKPALGGQAAALRQWINIKETIMNEPVDAGHDGQAPSCPEEQPLHSTPDAPNAERRGSAAAPPPADSLRPLTRAEQQELTALRKAHTMLRLQYQQRCDEIINLNKTLASPALLADPDTHLRDRLLRAHEELHRIKEVKGKLVERISDVTGAVRRVAMGRLEVLEMARSVRDYLTEVVSKALPRLLALVERVDAESTQLNEQLHVREEEVAALRDELSGTVELKQQCDAAREKVDQLALLLQQTEERAEQLGEQLRSSEEARAVADEKLAELERTSAESLRQATAAVRRAERELAQAEEAGAASAANLDAEKEAHGETLQRLEQLLQDHGQLVQEVQQLQGAGDAARESALLTELAAAEAAELAERQLTEREWLAAVLAALLGHHSGVVAALLAAQASADSAAGALAAVFAAPLGGGSPPGTPVGAGAGPRAGASGSTPRRPSGGRSRTPPVPPAACGSPVPRPGAGTPGSARSRGGLRSRPPSPPPPEQLGHPAFPSDFPQELLADERCSAGGAESGRGSSKDMPPGSRAPSTHSDRASAVGEDARSCLTTLPQPSEHAVCDTRVPEADPLVLASALASYLCESGDVALQEDVVRCLAAALGQVGALDFCSSPSGKQLKRPRSLTRALVEHVASRSEDTPAVVRRLLLWAQAMKRRDEQLRKLLHSRQRTQAESCHELARAAAHHWTPEKASLRVASAISARRHTAPAPSGTPQLLAPPSARPGALPDGQWRAQGGEVATVRGDRVFFRQAACQKRILRESGGTVQVMGVRVVAWSDLHVQWEDGDRWERITSGAAADSPEGSAAQSLCPAAEPGNAGEAAYPFPPRFGVLNPHPPRPGSAGQRGEAAARPPPAPQRPGQPRGRNARGWHMCDDDPVVPLGDEASPLPLSSDTRLVSLIRDARPPIAVRRPPLPACLATPHSAAPLSRVRSRPASPARSQPRSSPAGGSPAAWLADQDSPPPPVPHVGGGKLLIAGMSAGVPPSGAAAQPAADET